MTELERKILDASIELVVEQGVRAVSFREVARRAGVSHQAPYHHFKNQQGLLRAIALEGFEGLNTAMKQAASGHREPMDALIAAGHAYVTFAVRHIGHFRVMFQNALVDIHDESAPVLEATDAYGTLLCLATAAHDAGHGRGISTEHVTWMCWSVVHGIANLLVEGILAKKGSLSIEQQEGLATTVVSALGSLMRAERGA